MTLPTSVRDPSEENFPESNPAKDGLIVGEDTIRDIKAQSFGIYW